VSWICLLTMTARNVCSCCLGSRVVTTDPVHVAPQCIMLVEALVPIEATLNAYPANRSCSQPQDAQKLGYVRIDGPHLPSLRTDATSSVASSRFFASRLSIFCALPSTAPCFGTPPRSSIRASSAVRRPASQGLGSTVGEVEERGG
jgi:hypothetical protein